MKKKLIDGFVVKLKNDINISEEGIFDYLKDLTKLEMGAEYESEKYDIGFLLKIYTEKEVVILPAVWFEFLSNKILNSRDYKILKNMCNSIFYRDRLRSVVLKCQLRKHYLTFIMNDGNEFDTPSFPIGQMFCGMEINREYNLEELGIYE